MAAKDSQSLISVLVVLVAAGIYFSDDIQNWWARQNRSPEETQAQITAMLDRRTLEWKKRCEQGTPVAKARTHFKRLHACVLAVGHMHSNCKSQNTVNSNVSCLVDISRLDLPKKRRGCVVAQYNMTTGNFDWPRLQKYSNEHVRRLYRAKREGNDCSPENAATLLFGKPGQYKAGKPLLEFYDQPVNFRGNTIGRKTQLLYADSTEYETLWYNGFTADNTINEDQWANIEFEPLAAP